MKIIKIVGMNIINITLCKYGFEFMLNMEYFGSYQSGVKM